MDYLFSVMANMGMIAFVALSAYLLLIVGQISFGQQGFFAIGAYVAGICTAVWQLPLSLAILAAAAVAGIAGRSGPKARKVSGVSAISTRTTSASSTMCC